jgi:hypothetical protein
MKQASRSHFTLAKYQLARMALEDPGRFFSVIGPGGDATYLPRLWHALGAELEPDDYVPPAGLSVHATDGPYGELLTLVLPEPRARNEVYFFALAHAAKQPRVFALEFALMPPRDDAATMVAEFRPDGRANWGQGPTPTLVAFQQRVCDLLADPTLQPLTFIPMRLLTPHAPITQS